MATAVGDFQRRGGERTLSRTWLKRTAMNWGMVDGDVTQQLSEPRDLQRLTAPKATIEYQKHSDALANPTPPKTKPRARRIEVLLIIASVVYYFSIAVFFQP
jgi:hypothetical protein